MTRSVVLRQLNDSSAARNEIAKSNQSTIICWSSEADVSSRTYVPSLYGSIVKLQNTLSSAIIRYCSIPGVILPGEPHSLLHNC